MKTKVEPNEKRYPTTKWSGNYFSESMPAGGKDPSLSPTSSAATTPQGLSSINRVRVRGGGEGGRGRGKEGKWRWEGGVGGGRGGRGGEECCHYDVLCV